MKTSQFLFLAISILFASGCKPEYSPMIIAHRGASGYETENTIAAFQKAFELKADAIELDLWRTTDDSLVVFHDKNTKRLAGDSLVISQSTYAELRALTLPGDQKIPTLREVLEILPRDVKIVVELKNCWEEGKAGDNFPELAEQLKATGTLNRAIIISFNIEKLVDARQYLPKTPLHYLTYQKEPAEAIVNRALEAKVDGININFGLAEDELVNLAREKNLEVLVWTVNKPEMAKELAEKYRVDAITTDFPDLIEKAVKEIGKSD